MPRLRLVPFTMLALQLAAMMTCGLVQAQLVQAQDDVDPPGRVARLRYLEGPVSVATAGSNDAFPATVNRPLTSGDALSTDGGARAELELDGALLHVDGDTDVRWTELDDAVARLQLTTGTLGVTVRHLDADQRYEIDAPGTAVLLRRVGDYRIASDDGNVVVSVRAGEAEVNSENQTLRLAAGQRGVFTTGSGFSARVEPLPRPDEFDRWRDDRGRQWTAGASAGYVGAGVIGYEELAQYGAWQSVPQYGYVWYPNVAVEDWAPYRFGQWAWIAPWGWTWVDDEPWGFAPFHYGRWAYVGRGWCWVPAPPRQRAVYAPALVAWVGNPGAGAPGRGVGWFPLAPGEVYVPAHRASPRYVERVNLGGSASLRPDRIAEVLRDPRRQSYVNRDAPRAVSAVPDSSFVRAQPVPGHLLRDRDLGDVRGGTPRATPPAMAPERTVMPRSITTPERGITTPERGAGRDAGRPDAGAGTGAAAPAPESMRRRLPERSPQFSPPIQQQRAPVSAPREPRAVPDAPPPARMEPPRAPVFAPAPQLARPPQPFDRPAPPRVEAPRVEAPRVEAPRVEAPPPPRVQQQQMPQAPQPPQAQREEHHDEPRGRDPRRAQQ